MKSILTLLLFSAVSLSAQRSETLFYRARLLASNEVPAVALDADGYATIRAHVVRDAQGAVISGTVDFLVSHNLPGAATFTGLHIHRGAAGVNGPVVIDSGIGGTAGNIESATGRGVIERPAQVTPDRAAALTALRDMIANPSGFYVNLHTTANPGGVIRGQLQAPETITLLSVLSPRNEVPAITNRDEARGLAAVTVMRTYGADGRMDAAQVLFETEYDLGAQVTFTGFHIHTGPAGVNGPVTVNTGLTRLDSTPSGRGRLIYPVEMDMSRQASIDVVNLLFADPMGAYVNLHTTEFPGGFVRGQLRRTDVNQFDMLLLPRNEVPPVNLDASGPSNVKLYTVRGPDGAVIAAKVDFDINYRFPAGETRFIGLHIHDQVAGQNGPVTIDSGLVAASAIVTTTGFGNIFLPGFAGSAMSLAAINSLVANPDRHYVNLHTSANPGGAVREQVGVAFSAAPAVSAVTSGAGPQVANVAPAGSMAIYGSRFSHVSTNLATAWEGPRVPSAMNGTMVTVAGIPAPILSILPHEIVVQVPVEATPGSHPVVVRNSGGASNTATATVRATAPSLFYFTGDQGVVLNAATETFVTRESPLTGGDVALVVYTGGGLPTPRLPTGAIVPDTLPTAAGQITLGGRPALALASVTVPGLPGLYAMVFSVPNGLPAGMQPLEITIGGERSNSVMVPIR